MVFASGRKLLLDERLKEEIISHVPKALFPSIVSGLVRIHTDTLKTYLEQGEKDHLADIDTIFSQLFLDYRQKFCQAMTELVNRIFLGERKWKQAAWLLERMDDATFAANARLVKEWEDKLNFIITVYQGGMSNLTHQKPVVKQLPDDVVCSDDNKEQ